MQLIRHIPVEKVSYVNYDEFETTMRKIKQFICQICKLYECVCLQEHEKM